jgi:ABC-type transporter Mla subunit MlaD
MSMLGGVNPLALAGRAVDTATHVTAELVQALTNFNETMREINTAARRVNSLLDEIEQPIKIVVPQVTSTLKRFDAVLGQIGSLPSDVTKAVSMLGDLASRLGPLAQFAETAGGLFGVRTPPK